MKLKTLAITIGAMLLAFNLSAQSAAELQMAKKMAKAQGYSDAEINALINRRQGWCKNCRSYQKDHPYPC